MKIGIMSFAHHHAESYINSLQKVDGVDWIGVADIDQPRAKAFAAQTNSHYYSSYEGLLAAKPEGVIITAENSNHRALVEMAASQKVNILCEKPLATTREDARNMVQTCKKAGVLLMTAFPMRFSPPALAIKQQLDRGDFGRIYCFNGSNQGELPSKYRNWFIDRKLAGGGAIMDHTVHLVDLFRWYLNSEVVEVYAGTNHIFHASEVEPDVETGGQVFLTFANGVFATIDCSWSRPGNWPTWGGLSFELVCERGAVLMDGFSQNVTTYGRDPAHPTWGFWGSDMNREMITEFVQSIRENRLPSVTGVDGLRAVEVALAAYDSVRIGQPVRIEY
ncbi:MAG: Gfo/Idh/MocA family protein [Anaerolineaceae bacterium]